MAEEIYAVVLPNGQTFRCVKSQLEKTGGKCPIYKHDVYPEMVERYTRMNAAKAAMNK